MVGVNRTTRTTLARHWSLASARISAGVRADRGSFSKVRVSTG